jgi:5'-nucleotidase
MQFIIFFSNFIGMNRRLFIRNSSLVSGALLATTPLHLFADKRVQTRLLSGSATKRIPIFHTNDLRGQISFVDNDMRSVRGLGGLRQIGQLLRGQDGLILDAGSFLGEEDHHLTIAAMNETGYHAVTPGKQELALGQRELADLCDRLRCPLVNANYTFSGTPLSHHIQPWHIVYYGAYKIGVTAVGAAFDGIASRDPYTAAQESADQLRKMGCHLVVLLSHLGLRSDGGLPDSQGLAASTSGIDLILSGQGDAFQQAPFILRNTEGHEVVVSQGARQGMMMRQIAFTLTDAGHKVGFDAQTYLPGKPEGESLHRRCRQIHQERQSLA